MTPRQYQASSAMARLRYWITEREAIRKLKDAGHPGPWTRDPILQKYKFCNVLRRDDRVSRWVFENWIVPNYNDSQMLVAMCLARHFNTIPFLSRIGYPAHFSPEDIRQHAHNSILAEEKQFSAAYMIKCGKGQSKVDYVLETVVRVFDYQRAYGLPELPPIMEQWVDWLCGFKGFGSFLAGQVVADLRWGMVGPWRDRRTWAPIGPGSRRGMNRYHGRELKKSFKPGQFLDELQGLMRRESKKLPTGLTRRMEAIDWQNCLCEFDKYERTVWDGKRPKQLYKSTM